MNSSVNSKVVLSQIPMPISHNKCYAAIAIPGGGNRWFGKIRPTTEFNTYVKEFQTWALVQRVAIAKARKFIREEILMKEYLIGVDTNLCFHGANIWDVEK